MKQFLRHKNSHAHIKSGLRVILLFALVSLLSSLVYAQNSSTKEAESKPSLELKLTSFTPSVCIDSKLSLELAVTNVSHEDVVIDMSKLWTQFSYSYTDDNMDDNDEVDRAGAMGIGTSGIEKQLVVLYPGNTVRSTYDYSLALEFFQATGKYKLRTRINSIDSNGVKFTLNDCGKTLKIEDK